jgi:hypothetical protein
MYNSDLCTFAPTMLPDKRERLMNENVKTAVPMDIIKSVF